MPKERAGPEPSVGQGMETRLGPADFSFLFPTGFLFQPFSFSDFVLELGLNSLTCPAPGGGGILTSFAPGGTELENVGSGSLWYATPPGGGYLFHANARDR
jgi:hypothetical protein